MKKLHLLFCLIIGLGLLTACNRQQANKPADTIQQEASTNNTPKKRRQARDKDRDAAAIMINRLSQKIQLTEEQKLAIRELAAELNFAADTKEERKAAKKQFREAIKESILTEEQNKVFGQAQSTKDN